MPSPGWWRYRARLRSPGSASPAAGRRAAPAARRTPSASARRGCWVSPRRSSAISRGLNSAKAPRLGMAADLGAAADDGGRARPRLLFPEHRVVVAAPAVRRRAGCARSPVWALVRRWSRRGRGGVRRAGRPDGLGRSSRRLAAAAGSWPPEAITSSSGPTPRVPPQQRNQIRRRQRLAFPFTRGHGIAGGVRARDPGAPAARVPAALAWRRVGAVDDRDARARRRSRDLFDCPRYVRRSRRRAGSRSESEL